MAAQIVYDDVAEGADLGGQLFAGITFWIAQRVPSRNTLIEKIKSNGGDVALLEKKADHLIADHFRKDCPPGSISYTFIEKSIRNGALEDPNNHLAGPPSGAARGVGSISKPARSTRAAYTAEEDRTLYKWVRDYERTGGSTSGNEIYKQLEEKYPRHTWQSWRDRYIKKLRDQPPAGLNVPENAPPSPLSDQSAEQLRPSPPAPKEQNREQEGIEEGSVAEVEGKPHAKRARVIAAKKKEFTTTDLEVRFGFDDWEELYANVEHIAQSDPTQYTQAWEGWARTDEANRTADEWRQYFEKIVRPEYDADSPRRQAFVVSKVRERHEKEEQDKEAAKQSVKRTKVKSAPKEAVPSTPTRKHSIVSPSRRPAPSVELLIAKAMAKRRGEKRLKNAYMFYVLVLKMTGASIEAMYFIGTICRTRSGFGT